MTVGRQLAPRHRRLRMSCPARPARSTIKTGRYEPDQTPRDLTTNLDRRIVPNKCSSTRSVLSYPIKARIPAKGLLPSSSLYYLLIYCCFSSAAYLLTFHTQTSQLLPDVVHGAVDRFSSLSVVPGTGASCCCCCCRRR